MYGPESAVFYTTPLYYIAHEDRGGAADEIINCSFNINIKKWDKAFDYIRIYATTRTSIDGVPSARKVQDIIVPKEYFTEIDYSSERKFSYSDFSNPECVFTPRGGVPALPWSYIILNNAACTDHHCSKEIRGTDYSLIQIHGEYIPIDPDEILTFSWYYYNNFYSDTSFTITSNKVYVDVDGAATKVRSYKDISLSIEDTGAIGETIPATSLLYKGGTELIAQTMAAKDNTLFLGNLELFQKNIYNISVDGETLKEYISGLTPIFSYNANKALPSPTKEGFYPYENQLKYNS